MEIDVTTQQKAARFAGLLYLIVIIAGIFANLIVRESIVVSGDATATANNIMANELLFQIGFIGDIIVATSWALLGIALFIVFEPFNKNQSLLMVILFSIGVPILMLNSLNHYAALILLSGNEYLTVFNGDQLNALGLFFLDLHNYGYYISAIFTSLCLIPLGYLVVKSRYLPKSIGYLLIISFILAEIDHILVFLSPWYEANVSMLVLLPAAIAEFATCGWLLLKGVNIQE